MNDIKIITEPTVYLIGQQAIVEDGLAAFLADHGVPGWESSTSVPGQVLAEIGGRCCYMSFANPRPGGNASYLKHVIEVDHTSVLEHAVFTLILTGISRSCSHELVRHRVGLSPSQLSQRYVDESEVAFVLPSILEHSMAASMLSERLRQAHADESPESWGDVAVEAKARFPALNIGELYTFAAPFERWFNQVRSARESYRSLADSFYEWLGDEVMDRIDRRKRAREQARSVLPNCTETKIQLTGNARAWRHLFDLRGSAGADAEIRRLAIAIHCVLNESAPNLFGDYSVASVGGVDVLSRTHPKV